MDSEILSPKDDVTDEKKAMSELSTSDMSQSFSGSQNSLEKNIETLGDEFVNSNNVCDEAFNDNQDILDGERKSNSITSSNDKFEALTKSTKYDNLLKEQCRCDKDENANEQTHGTKNSIRKIPKSRTFDAGSLSYFSKQNDKGDLDTYRENSAQKRRTNSRTHVFMTSQECVVVPGCKLPRETIASRLRFEKQHISHDKICGFDEYQTPLQRKDAAIKDLKRQVRELTSCIEDKDKEIDMYKQHVNEETSKLVQGKDDEIARLREELRKLGQSYDEISSFCEETVSTASRMEQKAEELKAEITDRELQHQKIYLEMYRKGQESARFEREDELERLATAGGCKVTISELVKKLAWTEVELAKWQTIRRQESYQDALRPDTEAETTLRFLRDSLFHYLTDDRESDDHLRAVIKIMNFSEAQIEKIKGGKLIQKIEKKRRSMSTNK